MADLRGTIIYGPIYPPNTEQKFATHDADYGKGGYRSVNSIEERDNITFQRRTVGMEVRVLGDGPDAGVYILKSFEGSTRFGVTKQEWEKVDGGSLSKEITISGGPLSNTVVNSFPGGKIPAGTKIEDILTTLLCKEDYPTPSYQTASLSATISAPTITCDNHSSSSDHLAIVGTTVTLTITSPSTTTASKTSNKVYNMSHGYKGAKLSKVGEGEDVQEIWVIDDSVISGDSYIEKLWEGVQIVDEKEEYKIVDVRINESNTYTGFSEIAPTEGVENSGSSEEQVSSSNSPATYKFKNRRIDLGVNKVSAKAQGKRYQGYVEGIDPVFYKSNIGNVSDGSVEGTVRRITDPVASLGTAEDPIKTLNAKSGEALLTITGVYPIYHNMVKEGDTFVRYDMNDWPTQFALTSGKNLTGDSFIIIGESETDRFSFIYPETHTPTIEVHDGNKWNSWAGGATSTEYVDKMLNNVKYKRYTLGGSPTGGGKLRISFNKNLSSK